MKKIKVCMIKIILGIFSVCILCVNNVLANDNEYNKEVEYDVVFIAIKLYLNIGQLMMGLFNISKME